MNVKRLIIVAAVAAVAIVGSPRADATGTYHTRIRTTSPCARSMRQVRLNHGAEDDLCAAWFGPRGYIHVGPMSDAPYNANFVG